MNKIFFVFLFLAASLYSALPLRIGMELAYPPFETICTDGKPCGISVDMAHALGAFLGRDIVIENIPFVGLIPSLNTEKIDLIISSMTVNEERSKAIAFSTPYATIGLCLLVNSDSTIKDIGDVDTPGHIVVVKSGTSGELYATKHLNRATVHILDRETMCVLEVVQGKADAFIYDQLSIYAQWQKHPTTTRALLKAFQQEHWAIGMRRDDQELRNAVDRFINAFRQEGGFDRLADFYLPEQKNAFQKLGIAFIF